MTSLATQTMIADALIYGSTHQLRPRPPQVLLNADDTVALDPGTRIVYAPPLKARKAGGAVIGRKWPQGEHVGQKVVAEEGDYVEVAARPCDDLFAMMAESNCRHANALGKAQLMAVWWCVMNRPFPLGDGEGLYRGILTVIEADALERATAALTARKPKTKLDADLWAAADKMSVGEIRRTLVNKAGSGCNAPTDSYLALAAQLAQGLPVTGY
jgi:hypothetical protein